MISANIFEVQYSTDLKKKTVVAVVVNMFALHASASKTFVRRSATSVKRARTNSNITYYIANVV